MGLCGKSCLGATLVVLLAIAAVPFFVMNDDPVDWRIKYLMHPIAVTLYKYCGMTEGESFLRDRFEAFIPKAAATHPSTEDGIRSFDLVIPVQYVDTEAQPLRFKPDSVVARMYVPENISQAEDGSLPLLVWYHGGGWTIGRIHERPIDHVCRRFANRGNMVVLSVDYRLAPEFPYPHAIEDAYAALKWVQADNPKEQPEELKKVNKDLVIVGGDSAGGNLAAVVSLMARDRQLPLKIAYQLLVYPSFFVRPRTKSSLELANAYLLPASLRRWFEFQYLQGNDSLLNLPYVAPFKAETLAGLPAAHVITASHDPLKDEGRLYYEALREAGVVAHHSHWENQVHGFFSMLFLEESELAISDAINVMKKVLPLSG